MKIRLPVELTGLRFRPLVRSQINSCTILRRMLVPAQTMSILTVGAVESLGGSLVEAGMGLRLGLTFALLMDLIFVAWAFASPADYCAGDLAGGLLSQGEPLVAHGGRARNGPD